MNTAGAVGIFDSGVGGLTVLREIRAALPSENMIYVADSGHVPYGNKSLAYIRERSLLLTSFLLEQGAKAIVVACNTATAAAAKLLRSTFSIPIVAMEPAVKPATEATKVGTIGVLATVGTLANARFAALLERFGKGVEFVVQACPGLVEQVESGDLEGPATRKLVEEYTAPLRAAGVDVIVLGCTHYPFLRPVIADVVGPNVRLIDTGNSVAKQLKRVLESHLLLNASQSAGGENFWTTGSLREGRRVICSLWDKMADVGRLPEAFL